MKTKKQTRTKKVSSKPVRRKRTPLPVIEIPKGRRKPITTLSPDKVEIIKLQRRYAALQRKTSAEIASLKQAVKTWEAKYAQLLELRNPPPEPKPVPVAPPVVPVMTETTAEPSVP